MRTSLDELNRAYLKFYNNPDTLSAVKAEPTADLFDRVSRGQINNPIIINNQIKIKEEPIEVDEEYIPIQQQQQQQPIINKISINERKKINAKNWYEKNKEQHKANVKSRDKDPSTIRKRYIRELNNKVLDYSKLKPETITKYYIQYDKNKDFYY
jgi:type I site-specific restriction-modification system R (restriction) subunit